jgi:hypothetical protein
MADGLLLVVAIGGEKAREVEGTAVGGASSKQGGVGSRTQDWRMRMQKVGVNERDGSE